MSVCVSVCACVCVCVCACVCVCVCVCVHMCVDDRIPSGPTTVNEVDYCRLLYMIHGNKVDYCTIHVNEAA